MEKWNGNQFPTWEELVAMKPGTIVADWMSEDVRCIIMRGPHSLCAYLGIPTTHLMAGADYSNIPLDCNWGFN